MTHELHDLRALAVEASSVARRADRQVAWLLAGPEDCTAHIDNARLLLEDERSAWSRYFSAVDMAIKDCIHPVAANVRQAAAVWPGVAKAAAA